MQEVSKTKGFYFINKSGESSSLSKSTSSENTAIQRYVQSGRKRAREPRRSKNTSDSNTVSSDIVPNTSFKTTSHALQTAGRDQQRSKNKHDLSNSDLSKQSLQSANDRTSRQPSVYIRSPIAQGALNSFDPFDSSSVTLNKHVTGLLKYYMYYHHPSQWPNEMIVLRHGVYIFHAAVVRLLKNAVADRLIMYCLLSAAACRCHFVDRLPFQSVLVSATSYIGKALSLMASRIAGGTIEEDEHLEHILTCISFLKAAEAYRGDLEASKMHLIAAHRLLEPKGGLKYVKEESLRGQLAMGDLFIACVNLTPCLFDCSYDPGSASTLSLSEHEIDLTMFPGTASLLLGEPNILIPAELRTIILQLLESHRIKGQIRTTDMSPSRATEVTHWITMRNMAIRHRLLAIETLDAMIHALRVAIIMWTLLAMNITGRAKTVKVMAPKLMSCLSALQLSSWQGHTDMWLWVVLVGCYCSTGLSQESAWFLNECDNILSYHYVLSSTHISSSAIVAQLEEFQQKFFYDPLVQRDSTRALAERLTLMHSK